MRSRGKLPLTENLKSLNVDIMASDKLFEASKEYFDANDFT